MPGEPHLQLIGYFAGTRIGAPLAFTSLPRKSSSARSTIVDGNDADYIFVFFSFDGQQSLEITDLSLINGNTGLTGSGGEVTAPSPPTLTRNDTPNESPNWPLDIQGSFGLTALRNADARCSVAWSPT